MLHTVAFVYLLIPALIFNIGWIQLHFSIILTILLLCSFFLFLKNSQNNSFFKNLSKADWRRIIIMLMIIVAWVFFAGVGGFVWQNRWDHKFRNAVFMDLVLNEWPVINGETALCYYFGFWLPSAVVGKIFGLEAGYFAQTLWACTGIIITMFLVFEYLGTIKLRFVILFILFSGLDVLMMLFPQNGFALIDGQKLIDFSLIERIYLLLTGTHIEWLSLYFNSSCNTTLLFWLYNQIIPFWVGFLLILNQKDNKNIVTIYSLLFLFCPFPCVGLFPVIVYKLLKESNFTQHGFQYELIKKRIISLFTPENLCIIPFVLIVALLYKSNLAAGKIRVLPVNIESLLAFIFFFLVEYGIYLVFLDKVERKDTILRILLATVVFCSFIVMGNSFDFAWRTCIPATFYIMLLIMKKTICISFQSKKELILILVICMGAVTPTTEFIRTFKGEVAVLTGKENARNDSLSTIFTKENNECYDNFIADTHSVFYEHFAKQN